MPRCAPVVLAIVLAACAPPAARSAASIVNGAPDTAPGPIVAVIHTRTTGTRQLCTGTVVAPAVVLTAKHCVHEDLGGAAWEPIPVARLSIAIGPDVRAPLRELAVAAVHTTDGPYRDGDGARGGDLALLELDGDTGLTPVGIARDAPAVGAAIHIVGYGYTGSGATGSLGERHAADVAISTVSAETFESEGAAWTCTGDSGGPAMLASGAVAGVTSIGPRGCAVPRSIYTRVDRHLALIDGVLGTGCSPVPETCNGIDDDCDGTIDPDCGDATAPDGGATTPPSPSGGCSALHARAPWSAVALITLAAALRRRRRA